MLSLTEKTRFHRVMPAAVSGTSTLTTTALDLAGGGAAVCFALTVSSITGVSIQRQQTLDGSTWTNSGSAFVPTAANAPIALDYLDPDTSKGTQVRLEITRGSAAAVSDVLALQHDARRVPTTQPTNTQTHILTGSEVV